MRDREGTDRQTDRDGAGAARRVRARERVCSLNDK